MNIYEGYERLLGCIIARTAEEFFLFYGGCKHKKEVQPEERILWQQMMGVRRRSE